MLMPSIFTNTYFNDFFEDPFKSLDYNTSGLMTTDEPAGSEERRHSG